MLSALEFGTLGGELVALFAGLDPSA